MAHSFNSKKIAEILAQPEPVALESQFEIEDLIAKIEEIDRKIGFWNGLIKNRIQTIQNDIQAATQQKDFLRKVIQLTLDKAGEDSLSFPGVGLVSKSKGKTTWVVTDKEKLLDILKENLSEERFEEIISLKPAIDKRKLDDLLEKLEKAGEVPVDCVQKEEGETSIKLRFAKDFKAISDDNSNTNDNSQDNSNDKDLGEIVI